MTFTVEQGRACTGGYITNLTLTKLLISFALWVLLVVWSDSALHRNVANTKYVLSIPMLRGDDFRTISYQGSNDTSET